MKEISIEWKHYDKKGETCTRCNNTGTNIKVLRDLSKNPDFRNVKVNYKETKLDADKMPESNSILINNKPIEDILNAVASENQCHSCSCLEGKDTNCRTIKLAEDTYEVIPEDLISEAIQKELNPSTFSNKSS